MIQKLRNKIDELNNVREQSFEEIDEAKKKIREIETENKKLIAELKNKLINISDPLAQTRIKSFLALHDIDEGIKEMERSHSELRERLIKR